MNCSDKKLFFSQSSLEDFDDIELKFVDPDFSNHDYQVQFFDNDERLGTLNVGSGLTMEQDKIFISGEMLKDLIPENAKSRNYSIVFFRIKDQKKKILFLIDYSVTRKPSCENSSKTGTVKIVNENKVIVVQMNDVNNYGSAVGIRGKNNFELYLETTTDSPPKTMVEWLESQKVKGDKGADGKPFEFQDLTPAQLILMKGQDGRDGIDGVAGRDGINGTNGTNGKDGLNGLNGKDAFEVWKTLNPTGTLSDFWNFIGRKKSIMLTEIFSSATNLFAEVPELSFNLESGKDYRIKLIGTVQSVAITTGVQIGFTFSGNIISNGFLESSITPVSSATTLRVTIYDINSSLSGIGGKIITTGTGVINTPVLMNSEIVVRCVDAGTFKTFFASEINGSQAQMNIGSTFIIEEI